MERDDFGLPVRKSLPPFAEEKEVSKNRLRRECKGVSPLTEERLFAKSGDSNNRRDRDGRRSKAQVALSSIAEDKVAAVRRRGDERKQKESQRTKSVPTNMSAKRQTQDSKTLLDVTINVAAPPSSTASIMTVVEADAVKGATSLMQGGLSLSARDSRKSIATQQATLEHREAKEARSRRITQDLHFKEERRKLKEQQRRDRAMRQKQLQQQQQEQHQNGNTSCSEIGASLQTVTINDAVKSRAPALRPTDATSYKSLSSDVKSAGVYCSSQKEVSDEENQLPVAVSNNASPDGYLSIEQIVALPDTDSSEHSVENQKVESDVVCLSDQDEDRIIRFLYKQKVYGFPRSNGGYLSNFWHYFKNDHPLFSICLCHQLNPYTKRNRAIVYFCVTSMAYCLTVGLMETDYIMDNNVCRAGCDVTSSDSNGKCACSGGMNDGKSCSSFNYICDYISPIAVGALCGAFVVVYGATLRAFATFGCCQGNRSLQAKCASCISFASVFGGHVLTFFLGFSMCSLIVVLLVVEVDPQQHVRILYAFGVSKLLSAVYW